MIAPGIATPEEVMALKGIAWDTAAAPQPVRDGRAPRGRRYASREDSQQARKAYRRDWMRRMRQKERTSTMSIDERKRLAIEAVNEAIHELVFAAAHVSQGDWEDAVRIFDGVGRSMQSAPIENIRTAASQGMERWRTDD